MSTPKYGIIGWPVEHSLSPRMQGAAFSAAGINATYDLLPVEPSELKHKVDELKRAGYSGWNVTVPHKKSIIPFLDKIEENARFADSVNTVINQNGKLYGYSTDGYGLEHAIREAFNLEVRNRRFLFWGTGGAAQAAATHFATQGADAIFLVNRTREKAESLKERLDQISTHCTVEVLDRSETERIKEYLSQTDVLIQCTSIGLKAEDPISISGDLLLPSLRIIDMIYSETKVLREAAARGCEAVNGSGMLLHQGAKAFTIWTGESAPVEVMRKALDCKQSIP